MEVEKKEGVGVEENEDDLFQAKIVRRTPKNPKKQNIKNKNTNNNFKIKTNHSNKKNPK